MKNYKLNDEDLAVVEKYGHLFHNTGGNDIQELCERNVNAQTNWPVALLQACCISQIGLLHMLKKEGLLK